MATRTSVGTGAWSAAGTWDTGVPLDGDDVVIALGHTVTFDVDQTSFTTGIGLTITGTLTHTTAAGSYVLITKTGAGLTGAGTWNIGSSTTAMPMNSKHLVSPVSGGQIRVDSGLTVNIYGQIPTYKFIRLTDTEPIGETVLAVDTDVTGDIWAAGDSIVIANHTTQVAEERVIAAGGIAAGTITITAGLTAAKPAGSIVALMQRNVKILLTGVGSAVYGSASYPKRVTISGAQCDWSGSNCRLFDVVYEATIIGSTFIRGTNGIYGCGGFYVDNCVFMCKHARNSNNHTFNNCLMMLNLAEATNSRLTYNNCVMQGSSGALAGGAELTLNNCLMSGNGTDITASTFKAHNTTLGSTTEVNANYLTQLNNYSESIDHDGVDGAFKAWTRGGIVVSQETTKPTGYTQAYQHLLASATYPCHWIKTFSVEPGKTVDIEVQLRKDASMTYLPRAYLMASIGNPLAGATPVDTFTMTDSTNTWESDTFTITNSTAYEQDYTLWFVAKNASGNAYAAYDITTEGGSGGAVSIQPIYGRVSL